MLHVVEAKVCGFSSCELKASTKWLKGWARCGHGEMLHFYFANSHSLFITFANDFRGAECIYVLFFKVSQVLVLFLAYSKVLMAKVKFCESPALACLVSLMI